MFFCPVLNRPPMASRLLGSWLIKSTYPITLLTYADDPQRDDYHRMVDEIHEDFDHDRHIPTNLISIVDLPRAARGTADALNFAFRAWPNLGYYGFIGEDCQLETGNMPLVPRANYFGISWPSEGIHNERLCTHPVIGGELVRAVGWWALPGLFHNFFDTVWHRIGAELNVLHYTPQVSYLHDHPIRTGAPLDHVYGLGQAHYDADHQRFNDFCRFGLPRLIQRINPED